MGDASQDSGDAVASLPPRPLRVFTMLGKYKYMHSCPARSQLGLTWYPTNQKTTRKS